MDLAELSRLTGLERRKLRYVLDHNLVPELSFEIKEDELGRPRHFAEDVGIGIVCAARLQEVGLPHPKIRDFLSALLQMKFDSKDPLPALAYVLKHDLPAFGDWGEEGHTRIRVDGEDFGWRLPKNSRKAALDFSPLLVITLDLGRLRDQVFGNR